MGKGNGYVIFGGRGIVVRGLLYFFFFFRICIDGEFERFEV